MTDRNRGRKLMDCVTISDGLEDMPNFHGFNRSDDGSCAGDVRSLRNATITRNKKLRTRISQDKFQRLDWTSDN